jgi:transcriptional regulator with XRE-family HTH domain
MGPTRSRHSEQLAGSLLRLARTKRGWSQRRLATAANVPQSTVARIESGSRQPTIPMLERLLAAADFDLRTRLEPYDDHDDVLDALTARASEQQRAANDAAQDEFISALRAAHNAAQASA